MGSFDKFVSAGNVHRDAYKAEQAERGGGGEPDLWPAGWYRATIMDCQEAVSKAGNDMIFVLFRVRAKDGTDRTKKLRKFLLDEYRSPIAQTIRDRFVGAVQEAVDQNDPREWVGEKLLVRLVPPRETHNAGGYANDNEISSARSPADLYLLDKPEPERKDRTRQPPPPVEEEVPGFEPEGDDENPF